MLTSHVLALSKHAEMANGRWVESRAAAREEIKSLQGRRYLTSKIFCTCIWCVVFPPDFSSGLSEWQEPAIYLGNTFILSRRAAAFSQWTQFAPEWELWLPLLTCVCVCVHMCASPTSIRNRHKRDWRWSMADAPTCYYCCCLLFESWGLSFHSNNHQPRQAGVSLYQIGMPLEGEFTQQPERNDFEGRKQLLQIWWNRKNFLHYWFASFPCLSVWICGREDDVLCSQPGHKSMA